MHERTSKYEVNLTATSVLARLGVELCKTLHGLLLVYALRCTDTYLLCCAVRIRIYCVALYGSVSTVLRCTDPYLLYCAIRIRIYSVALYGSVSTVLRCTDPFLLYCDVGIRIYCIAMYGSVSTVLRCTDLLATSFWGGPEHWKNACASQAPMRSEINTQGRAISAHEKYQGPPTTRTQTTAPRHRQGKH